MKHYTYESTVVIEIFININVILHTLIMVIFEDLREYINYLEERNLLKKIYGADWNLEIGAITELVAFSKQSSRAFVR